MKKVRDDEMRAQYELKGGTKNRFAARYAKGTNVVLIDADVFRAFPGPEEVNAALRLLMKAGAKATSPRAKRQLKAS
jgi:hypothetical protein